MIFTIIFFYFCYIFSKSIDQRLEINEHQNPTDYRKCFRVEKLIRKSPKGYPASLNFLVLDKGRFHQAKSLQIPDNVVLVFLTPYSPELNPIERLWQDMKVKLFENVFTSRTEMQNKLTEILKNTRKPLSRV